MEVESGRISSSGLKQQKISGMFKAKRVRDTKMSLESRAELQRNMKNNLSDQNKSGIKEPKGTLHMMILNTFVTNF